MRLVSVRCSLLLFTILAGALGLLPVTALAYPAFWEFKGTVTTSEGAPASVIPVGSPLRVVVAFDTAEQPNSPQASAIGDGRRYNYVDVGSLQLAIYAGDCNPCIQTSIPGNNYIIVRDSWASSELAAVQDGYTFGMSPSAENDGFGFQVLVRDSASAFSPEIVDVALTESPLPVEPDPRIVDMALSVFEMFRGDDYLAAELDFVSVPTYGAYYFLSGRHCAYPESNTLHGFFGDDCIAAGAGGVERVADNGGSAGMGGFSKTIMLAIATPDANDSPDAQDDLGTVFGEVTFGGPGSLPVLRASSLPTEVARTNSNLVAYQEYAFGGPAPTPLQLIVDLGYEIYSNWENGSETRPSGSAIDIGLRPGGATVGTTLAVVDAGLVPASAMNALQNFNTLVCGAEGDDDGNGNYIHQLPDGSPWPDGAILGMATYLSDDNDGGREQGAKSVQLQLLACDGVDVSADPVLMQPGDGFYLAASIQTPARGSWAQDGQPTPAANGFVDAANTVRIVPDPEAPPTVLQQLVAGLEPVCTDCDFDPEFAIDVKPKSAVNTIKISDKGVIEVALLGSEQFNPADVDTGTLRLGTLTVRTSNKGNASCSMSDVNGDAITDMACAFQNQASNWQLGQTIVTLTGKLSNGETILASDTVRLVP